VHANKKELFLHLKCVFFPPYQSAVLFQIYYIILLAKKKKTVVNLQVCTVTDLRVFLKLCQVYLKSQEKRNILFSSPKWNLGNVPKVVIIFQRQRLALALQITYPKQVIYNRLI
jgi:hypothetical protein